jgi:hypothetical protein
MKYRIVEKTYLDGSPCYIVDVNRWYGWGVCNHIGNGIISKVGLYGGCWHISFETVEEAEDAIKRMKLCINSRKHKKVIKIIE